MAENAVEVGYSQHGAGANGLFTTVPWCSGDPSVVAMTPNTFAVDCVLYQKDASTNYQTLVWLMTGTPASPAWTLQATLDANVITKKVHIKSADILALNSTPVELITAPGAGKVIEVLSVQGHETFVSAKYLTNTTLQVIDKVTGNALFSDTATILAAVADVTAQLALSIGATALAITENGSVDLTVKNGDPTAGDSDIDIYITYKINTL